MMMMMMISFIFWIFCLLIKVGLAVPSCTLSVSVLDLGCHLHWTCSNINSSTTFTVQTKTQGEEWRNVSECYQISSSSCDVSQAFSDFIRYNLIKLELNQGLEQKSWTELCDPLKHVNAMFSPPVVSVSLEKRSLWVEVIFPCAPSVACQSEEDEEEEEEEEEEDEEDDCCPVTHFLKSNTTVMLYHKHNPADAQIFSEVVLEDRRLRQEFGWLVAGQEYCAVARFSSSPFSNPQCVHIPAPESQIIVGMLCGLLLVLLLLIMGCVLWRRWTSSDKRLPKALMYLQNLDQEISFVAESGPGALKEEENDENFFLEFLTLSSQSSHTKTQSACSDSQSLGGRYYSSPVLQQPAVDDDLGDVGSVDGETSPHQYPGPLWLSAPAGLVEASAGLEVSGVPLSTVIVAGGQEEEEEEEMERMVQVFLNPSYGND